MEIREPGRVVILCRSPRSEGLLQREAGGHRFQRVPPTEKRGRKQSSTVTVSVHSDAPQTGSQDLMVEESFCRGSGAGGQNRNKRDTCVILHHPASGITIREESQRTQESNRRRARQRLQEALEERSRQQGHAQLAAHLRAQRGTGERSDKIRTYQLHHDRAVDHRTGKECRWSDLERGRLELLLS